jgi:hypothetical protein
VRIIDEVKALNIAVTKNLEAIAANPDQVSKKQYKLLRREMFGSAGGKIGLKKCRLT